VKRSPTALFDLSPHQAWLAATLLWMAPITQASEVLSRRHACIACHHVERNGVGPTWSAIAAKYGDGSLTPEQIAASIRTGGTGKWGRTPMPPQPQVTQADLLALSTWILQGGRP
jgi:cytochrome c